MRMGRELSPAQLIERSIQKKYRKELWTPFILAIKRYQLIEEGDKIAVCISGGKDSMLMAKLMQILQKFSDFPFELEFLVMDPGYAPANRRKIEENAEKLQIPIHIFETDIFQVANGTEKNPDKIGEAYETLAKVEKQVDPTISDNEALKRAMQI